MCFLKAYFNFGRETECTCIFTFSSNPLSLHVCSRSPHHQRSSLFLQNQTPGYKVFLFFPFSCKHHFKLLAKIRLCSYSGSCSGFSRLISKSPHGFDMMGWHTPENPRGKGSLLSRENPLWVTLPAFHRHNYTIGFSPLNHPVLLNIIFKKLFQARPPSDAYRYLFSFWRWPLIHCILW